MAEWHARSRVPVVALDHRDACTSYKIQTPFPIWGSVRLFITCAMDNHLPWQSPVGLAIQVEAGPLVSYRSALNIKRVIHCSRSESPCTSRTQRFVAALVPRGSKSQLAVTDLGACWGYMHACTEQRCHSADHLVRHASPISSLHPKPAKCLVYNMRQFLK